MYQGLYKGDIRDPHDVNIRTGQSMWLLLKYINLFRMNNNVSELNIIELEKTKMIKHTLQYFQCHFFTVVKGEKPYRSLYTAYVTNEVCFEKYNVQFNVF